MIPKWEPRQRGARLWQQEGVPDFVPKILEAGRGHLERLRHALWG